MKKLTILIAGGIGYVLGTRAGRERYEQIKSAAEKVKNNPTVQDKAQQATDLAKEKAQQAAEAAKDKLPSNDATSSSTSTAGTYPGV